METKRKIIEKLDKKIEGRCEAMSESIHYMLEDLVELKCSVNKIRYLSYLKDYLTKDDGV